MYFLELTTAIMTTRWSRILTVLRTSSMGQYNRLYLHKIMSKSMKLDLEQQMCSHTCGKSAWKIIQV